MNYETCTITIDWNELTQQITDIDGTNPREMHWNIPHALYKSITPLDNLMTLGPPQAIIPNDEFNYIDENVTYDVVYYYRLSELRPGGEFFTEQVKIQVKHHILKYEAPYLANIEYQGGQRDGSGNLIRYTKLDLSEVDDNGDPLETIKDEWFWKGEGRISEWLEFIVNDVTIDIRMRGTFDLNLKTITVNADRRNYPAGRIGDVPVMSSSVSLGANNLVQTPYWWAEWHENVDEGVPQTWHDFWNSRMGVWDDTEIWYNTDWTTDDRTVTYPNRPMESMKDGGVIEPFTPEIRNLVLRANIFSTLINGEYEGNYYDANTGDERTGTVIGVARPGNNAGVGLGATLTFKNVRRGLVNGATIKFNYNGTDYSVTLSGIPVYDADDEYMKGILESQINDAIGAIPVDAEEPFIAVSFGPQFHIM